MMWVRWSGLLWMSDVIIKDMYDFYWTIWQCMAYVSQVLLLAQAPYTRALPNDCVYNIYNLITRAMTCRYIEVAALCRLPGTRFQSTAESIMDMYHSKAMPVLSCGRQMTTVFHTGLFVRSRPRPPHSLTVTDHEPYGFSRSTLSNRSSTMPK